MSYSKKSCNKGMLALVLSLALICSSLGTGATEVSAKSKVKINKKKLTLTVGGSSKLKISGTKKKVKWKSSKKSVATVSSKGKVKAKKNGKATITAKVGKKKFKCKVTVKKAKTEEEKVLELANKERRKQGLNALKMDSKLQKAAQVRAKELEKKYDHKRPNGKNYTTVLKSKGVTYRISAENIGKGQMSAEEVMLGWMNSPKQKNNILNKSYTKMGVGLYKSPYCYYWVQILAG
ncbi:MAG: Ig-like domain-containing protein [Lachnospiraceae bacterium]|nr:Ig-like domain-containing protein [Lachnospiraceae bacterium]